MYVCTRMLSQTLSKISAHMYLYMYVDSNEAEHYRTTVPSHPRPKGWEFKAGRSHHSPGCEDCGVGDGSRETPADPHSHHRSGKRRLWQWRWKRLVLLFILITYPNFDRFCCIRYIGSQLHFWMKQQYWGWEDRYRVVYPHIHILESIAFALLFAFGFSSPSITACLWSGFPISRKVNDKIFSFCYNNYPQNFLRTIFVSSK